MKPTQTPPEWMPLIKLLREQFRLDKLHDGLAALGIEADAFHVDLLTIVQELMGYQPDPDTTVFEMWDNIVKKGSDKEIVAFLRKIETHARKLNIPHSSDN
jgi:hypothetical protein